MTFKIPLNKPFFDHNEYDAVKEVMKSGMVSQGMKVEEFEEAIKKYTGAKYAVAVSSCTAGLYLVARARTGGDGEHWVVPQFSFPAMGKVIAEKNMERHIVDYEHMVDADLSTYNMDTRELEKTCENLGKFEYIVPIHQFGMPCEMTAIRKIAKEHDSFILEDAACALGSEYNGEKIGGHGTAVFSFHGRKIMTTGEGGMVVTDDEEIYKKVIEGRQFGRNRKGEFVGNGLNFKMSDIQAAIGIEQLKKMRDIVYDRNLVARMYRDVIGNEGLHDAVLPYLGEMDNGTNWQSYVIRISERAGRSARDAIMNRMREHGTEVQVGSYDNSNGRCKNSAKLARTTLALPIWPRMSYCEVRTVVYELNEAMRCEY